MSFDPLHISSRPTLVEPRLVMGFSGWMDGGDVSTGTVDRLADVTGAEPLAEIDPEDFHIYNMPGSMEVATLFRPHAKIADGLIEQYDAPVSTFRASVAGQVILFNGREPNLRWGRYADCVLELCRQFGVRAIYFIGSVAGLVPHTREPRLFCSVSDESLKAEMERFGVKFSDYEGPASFVTYLTRRAGEAGLPMVSLVAEVPAYIQGPNHRCIESVIRRLSGMLSIDVPLDKLRAASDVFEIKLNEALREHEELSQLIGKLEQDYDNEVFDTQMGDLKQWLQSRGIRLD